MSILGDRLRSARERKGFSQVNVRDRTGIHNKTLSGYENGVSEPDIETLRTLAGIYEVSLDWLTGNDQAKPKMHPVSTDESEFLRWFDENMEDADVFFYDFHQSPEEQKKQFMETMRALWELEKKRGNIKPKE